MRHMLPGSVLAPCHEHGQSVIPSPPDLQAPLRAQAGHREFPAGHSSAGKELRLCCPVPGAAQQGSPRDCRGRSWGVRAGSPEDPLGSASGPAMEPGGR